MLTTVKYRIYPNKEQETLIKKNIGCSRKIYNLLLHDYNNTKKLNKVSSYKNTYPYLKEADSLALANSLQNLKQAITNHYKNQNILDCLYLKRNANQNKHTLLIIKKVQSI